MAEPRKRSGPSRIHHWIETQCETEAEKEALSRRFQRMRELLTPGGARFANNGVVLNAMFDIVERELRDSPLLLLQPHRRHLVLLSWETVGRHWLLLGYIVKSIWLIWITAMLCHAWKGCTLETTMLMTVVCLCERHALTDLLDGLKAPCSCGMFYGHSGNIHR